MAQRRRHVLRSVGALLVGLSVGRRSLIALAQTSAEGSATELEAGPDSAWPETFGPAMWMRIPRIGVDSRISDVGIVDGYYEVPWFGVGRHADSHDPGEPGNSIFNGHVRTFTAGQVFQRLHELRDGDAVYVYTPDYRLDWAVEHVFAVPEEDNSFLQDTDTRRITLYTCTGRYNPIEQNFDQRLVALGELVNVVPRT